VHIDLEPLLYNPAFSDVDLVLRSPGCKDRIHHAHRVILCQASAYFVAALDGSFREAKDARIALQFDNDGDAMAFECLLQHIYSRPLGGTLFAARSMWIQADRFQCSALMKAIEEYLMTDHVSDVEEIVGWFDPETPTPAGLVHISATILTRLLGLLGDIRSGAMQENPVFHALPQHLMVAVLSHDDLGPVTEDDVDAALAAWLAKNIPSHGPHSAWTLLEQVLRPCYLSMGALASLVRHAMHAKEDVVSTAFKDKMCKALVWRTCATGTMVRAVFDARALPERPRNKYYTNRAVRVNLPRGQEQAISDYFNGWPVRVTLRDDGKARVSFGTDEVTVGHIVSVSVTEEGGHILSPDYHMDSTMFKFVPERGTTFVTLQLPAADRAFFSLLEGHPSRNVLTV
jgi:hypothetical protein